jgi:pimeloyl-ACP methyl ester carboxylesterase
MNNLRRTLLLAAAGLLLVTGCAPAIQLPWASQGGPPALARFYQQTLHWQSCSGGSCANLTVPLDYAHPDGATIEIAVFRAGATDPGHRIGSLVVNPGGPGASGIDFARVAAQIFPTSLRARFDLVGFDPRGVGQSAPIRCLTSSQLDAYTQEPAVPADAAQENQLVTAAQQLAQACKQRNGSELAHINTALAARDMDVLRAALGDSQLTYYGASYGTFMGALYAEQFPHQVRALVLDSALDPALGASRDDVQQAQSFERVLHQFFTWCAGLGDCPLGATPATVQARFVQLEGQVQRHPLPGSGARVVGGGPMLTAVASAMYLPEAGFPRLEQALGRAMSGDGSLLLAMSDDINGRDPSGRYSNLIESNIAISCVDRPHPTAVESYATQAQQDGVAAPTFGAAEPWSELPCAYWPVSAQIQPHPIHADGAAPILVVASRFDPATPYSWGVALSQELHSAALLTFDGTVHAAFDRGSSCIDPAVVHYLVDRATPSAGTVCES